MKTQFLLLGLFMGITCTTAAQDTAAVKPWKTKLEVGVNFNQSFFTENWTGGGVSSVSLGTLIKGNANYTKDKWSWTNDLQLQYGVQRNKDQSPRKLNDLIFIDSKLGYRFTEKLDFFGALNYMSQFAEGYKFDKDANGIETRTTLSRFMSPGYLTEAVGIRYQPVPYFWARVGVLALRQTFVMDDSLYLQVPENYGVPVGKNMKNDVGFQLMADFDKNLAENLNLKLRYISFGEYKDFSNTNHRVDLVLSAKVTKYINTNITAVMLYDKNQSKAVQWSETLALGVLFIL
jgi:hypothetical protein